MILEDILNILKKENTDIAYTENDISYSYSKLYKFVSNIYNFLLLNNIEKKPVIVYGNKQIYMKATFLACSYAGITYVPIDVSMPQERIKLIIEQVEPYCIIGDFFDAKYKTINFNQIEEIMKKNTNNSIDKIYMKPEDIYYIIFTSGSTGTPKGVKVTYKNLNSCINWLKNITKINKEIILNQAIFSFDLSVADLYLSLISGSEHYIIEDITSLDFAKIFKQLRKSNASFAVMTPSFADLLLTDKSFNKELLPNLKTILFCGEKLLNTTVKELYKRFNNIKIINSYGPTECTFAVASIEVTKENINQENIPVGVPKQDTKIFIIDKDRNILKENEVGEILIVGESVAEGYLQKNKNSFIMYNNEKAYLTGDLGYIKNGELYYKGRIDNQIKFKGYRIEISDIENNIYHLNYIDKVKVVTKISDKGIVTKLVAFIKIKNGISKSNIDIKKDLSKRIPNYMIPNIKILEEFPLNDNGKIDISKLRGIVNGE